MCQATINTSATHHDCHPFYCLVRLAELGSESSFAATKVPALTSSLSAQGLWSVASLERLGDSEYVRANIILEHFNFHNYKYTAQEKERQSSAFIGEKRVHVLVNEFGEEFKVRKQRPAPNQGPVAATTSTPPHRRPVRQPVNSTPSLSQSSRSDTKSKPKEETRPAPLHVQQAPTKQPTNAASPKSAAQRKES